MNKVLNKASWIIGLLFLIYVLLVLFPSCLFANKLKHGSFTVHYHSNEIAIDQLKSVLDKAEGLLQESDLYVPGKNQAIFICDSFIEFSFFAFLARRAFAINYPISQNIFLSKSLVSDDLIFRNGLENNKRSLSGVIAHETTHSLLENRLGTIAYKLLPLWKNEGYCDFVAKESSFNSQLGLQYICNEESKSDSHSYKYFEYMQLTNFLLEKKRLSINEFINTEFDLKELLMEYRSENCE